LSGLSGAGGLAFAGGLAGAVTAASGVVGAGVGRVGCFDEVVVVRPATVRSVRVRDVLAPHEASANTAPASGANRASLEVARGERAGVP